RKASQQLDRYFPQFSAIDAIDELRLVDCGNVAVTPGSFTESAENMERVVGTLARDGYRILSFGGDGSVTLPQLRGWGPITSDLVVLHFDAHSDAYPQPDPDIHTTATTFTAAAREGAINPKQCMHIGMRGTVSVQNVAEFDRGLGFSIIDNEDMRSNGVEATMGDIREFVGHAPVYVCWDMDFFDPSAAPGVCNPTWGGVSAGEGLTMLKALAGIDLVAMDINNVVPDSDVNGMTAHLAATVALAGLHLFRRAT
ncbi:MAG: arginase family protein, partial [Fimbriimonadaceae bacterium]|nr:arginase family protein [Alphaproteobacteria bacterium]